MKIIPYKYAKCEKCGERFPDLLPDGPKICYSCAPVTAICSQCGKEYLLILGEPGTAKCPECHPPSEDFSPSVHIVSARVLRPSGYRVTRKGRRFIK